MNRFNGILFRPLFSSKCFQLNTDRLWMDKFWQTERVFFDGDDYFHSLISDIDKAQSLITIEMYIFNDDILGRKIASHLINAHARGVKVEIIVDGIGSFAFYEKLYGIFHTRGIFVKMYNPLPFYHPYYGKLSFSKKWQAFFLRLFRLNNRNHRKIFTIDQNIMYAGSYNITSEHTRLNLARAWQDMGVRVTGENVKIAILNFKRTWRLKEYFKLRKVMKKTKHLGWKKSPLRLNHTLFMKQYFYRNFLDRIQKSQQKVWLTTPYFIPKRGLIRALGKAAQRGVDVRLLLSSKTDVELFRTLQLFYYSYLIRKGVKVFQYTDTILHAKNYIIDDWTTVGTTNLNHRSLIHDLEVDLVIQDPENLKLIENQFETKIVGLREITEEELRTRPLWDKVLSRLFFLFKYWF